MDFLPYFPSFIADLGLKLGLNCAGNNELQSRDKEIEIRSGEIHFGCVSLVTSFPLGARVSF